MREFQFVFVCKVVHWLLCGFIDVIFVILCFYPCAAAAAAAASAQLW